MLPFKAKITIENKIIKSIIEADKCELIIKNTNNYDVISEEILSYNSDFYFLKGLVDSHCHIFGLGVKLLELNLENCKSIEDCLELCEIEIKKNNLRNSESDNIKWLIGRGWNQENWENQQLPNKRNLDKFDGIAVYLTRIDGHSAWVNSKALELAKITNQTKSPYGGEILIDKEETTGILIDNAMYLVKSILPKYTDEQIEKYILTAIDNMVENGLVGAHDMDVSPNILKIFQKLEIENKLKLKVNSYVSAQNDEWKLANVAINKYYSKLNICGLKFYSDGALGSRGAYLVEDYSDAPTKGLLLLEEEDFLQKIKQGAKLGWQIVTHAIGDAANKFVLDVYGRFREETQDYNTILRIEHCQIIQPEDLHKFNKYKIFGTIQPIFCKSDFDMAQKRLGERVAFSYPWKSLLNINILVGGSSDFPIESSNPFISIDFSINRNEFPILSKDNNLINSNENLSLEEALFIYDTTHQYISGEITNFKNDIFDYKKSIINDDYTSLIGEKANLIVIDNDLGLNDGNYSNIKNTKVITTISDGDIVYNNFY